MTIAFSIGIAASMVFTFANAIDLPRMKAVDVVRERNSRRHGRHRIDDLNSTDAVAAHFREAALPQDPTKGNEGNGKNHGHQPGRTHGMHFHYHKHWKPGFPIIAVGMPKSGSTSLHYFFSCNGLASVHQVFKDPIVGPLWYRHLGPNMDVCDAMIKKHGTGVEKLLDCMPRRDAYTQLDVEYSAGMIKGQRGNTGPLKNCFFPQITYLERLADEYPNATFVMPTRDPNNWFHSVVMWSRMDRRISECELPELDTPFHIPDVVTDPHESKLVGLNPSEALKSAEWKQRLVKFYNDHIDRTRRILKKKNIQLIEFDIEDPTAGKILTEAFGGKDECWTQVNKFGATNQTLQSLQKSHH